MAFTLSAAAVRTTPRTAALEMLYHEGITSPSAPTALPVHRMHPPRAALVLAHHVASVVDARYDGLDVDRHGVLEAVHVDGGVRAVQVLDPSVVVEDVDVLVVDLLRLINGVENIGGVSDVAVHGVRAIVRPFLLRVVNSFWQDCCALVSARMTLAPCSTNLVAIARPNLLAAPVTTATFPESMLQPRSPQSTLFVVH